MTGVNIITYYSPRIFATLGIASTDLKLFATGFYGVAKTLGMIIFSFYVADHLGRRKGLLWGSALGCIPMVLLSVQLSFFHYANPYSFTLAATS